MYCTVSVLLCQFWTYYKLLIFFIFLFFFPCLLPGGECGIMRVIGTLQLSKDKIAVGFTVLLMQGYYGHGCQRQPRVSALPRHFVQTVCIEITTPRIKPWRKEVADLNETTVTCGLGTTKSATGGTSITSVGSSPLENKKKAWGSSPNSAVVRNWFILNLSAVPAAGFMIVALQPSRTNKNNLVTKNCLCVPVRTVTCEFWVNSWSHNLTLLLYCQEKMLFDTRCPNPSPFFPAKGIVDELRQ